MIHLRSFVRESIFLSFGDFHGLLLSRDHWTSDSHQSHFLRHKGATLVIELLRRDLILPQRVFVTTPIEVYDVTSLWILQNRMLLISCSSIEEACRKGRISR